MEAGVSFWIRVVNILVCIAIGDDYNFINSRGHNMEYEVNSRRHLYWFIKNDRNNDRFINIHRRLLYGITISVNYCKDEYPSKMNNGYGSLFIPL